MSQLDVDHDIGDVLGAGTGIALELQNLPQSFNRFITTSGSNPTHASLQRFLKTVAQHN